MVFSGIFGNKANEIFKKLKAICSYLPFTSPMVMFTRIAMSTVPWYEIAISIGVLIASTVGTGGLAAKIYRVYGFFRFGL